MIAMRQYQVYEVLFSYKNDKQNRSQVKS